VVVILVVVGVFVLIVLSSIIGARRGTPMAFDSSDPDTERSRMHAQQHINHHDGSGS
jgi:hypothetical protein